MHPALQHLGNIIREARSRLGLSQRQLAERAGLSSGMLCLIEKGEANPSVQSLLGLADALALPLASFFDEHTTAKSEKTLPPVLRHPLGGWYCPPR